jgi:hypothetical protein
LNFYTLEWEEAINALISRITQILEGDDAKQKVELLKKIDADEMDIAQVKEEIVNSIKQSLSTTPSMHNIIAAMVLGQSSAQQQPLPSHHQNTNGVGQKPASDSSKDNQDT